MVNLKPPFVESNQLLTPLNPDYDTGNTQSPLNFIKINFLVARDFSGKTQIFRHRRCDLCFAINAFLVNLVTMKLVSSDIMTADALTKPYGPLEHWKRIAHPIGESEPLDIIRTSVFSRYGK